MKKIGLFLLFLLTAGLMSSCNKDEGTGGTATLEGNVIKILHPDDNFNLETDTVAGAKTDVFLVYGTDEFYGDDVEADENGYYQFKYLTPGTYTVYAYSTLSTGEQIAVSQTVEVKRGKITTVPNLIVHEGKAYGTSIVKGTVNATYIDKDGATIATGPAYEQRMYIQRVGEDFPFADVRAGIDGVFMFQKITPGNYIVFTTSIYDEDQVPFIVQKSVTVTDPQTIVEINDPFQITIRP